jgi:RalA-binding protein 1
MSQYDGAVDAQQHFSAQDSPTAGRQNLYQSPLNNNHPSDSGFRCVKFERQGGDAAPHTVSPWADLTISLRSIRKAAPSPLQTSTTAASPVNSSESPKADPKSPVDTNSFSKNASYHTPNSDEPRSPVERLDDLLASEQSFYQGSGSPPRNENLPRFVAFDLCWRTAADGSSLWL